MYLLHLTKSYETNSTEIGSCAFNVLVHSATKRYYRQVLQIFLNRVIQLF